MPNRFSPQRYSFSFTSDTGLLGPLSLVAFVSGRDGNGNGHGNEEGLKLRGAALRMMKEYLSFGSGGDDEGGEPGSGGFWVGYFRRLGFVDSEVLEMGG